MIVGRAWSGASCSSARAVRIITGYPAEAPVIVGGYQRTWDVQNVTAMEEARASRDSRGGAVFWLADDGAEYPTLAVRISGNVADVHYFPHDGHPGFRCVGGEGLPKRGMTTLVYDGCDPGSGEDTPNEFVVSVSTACEVAKEFFRTKQMSDAVFWFEL
jgi:hypothetical protein